MAEGVSSSLKKVKEINMALLYATSYLSIPSIISDDVRLEVVKVSHVLLPGSVVQLCVLLCSTCMCVYSYLSIFSYSSCSVTPIIAHHSMSLLSRLIFQASSYITSEACGKECGGVAALKVRSIKNKHSRLLGRVTHRGAVKTELVVLVHYLLPVVCWEHVLFCIIRKLEWSMQYCYYVHYQTKNDLHVDMDIEHIKGSTVYIGWQYITLMQSSACHVQYVAKKTHTHTCTIQ